MAVLTTSFHVINQVTTYGHQLRYCYKNEYVLDTGFLFCFYLLKIIIITSTCLMDMYFQFGRRDQEIIPSHRPVTFFDTLR